MIKKAFLLAENIHLKIFGHQMSGAMHDFLNHLSWSFFGMIISSAVLFLVNVLAGRILGPTEYGNYNFVLAIAYILSVFMVFGQDMTVIKNVAGDGSEKEKSVHISNSMWVVAAAIIALSVLIVSLSAPIVNFFAISKTLLFFAVAYAAIFSLRTMLDSFLRSLYAFKNQAIFKALESLVIAISFSLFFFMLGKKEYQFYLISLMSGFLFFCCLFFYHNRIQFGFFQKSKFLKTLAYSKKTLALSIVMILAASLDKLFVGKFIGLKELGIYSAYLTASILLITQLVAILSNAFLPMINAVSQKAGIIKKIDQLSFFLFIPGVFVLFLFSWLLFSLFGKAYELSFTYLWIFSISAFLQLSLSFYRNIAVSCEKAYAHFLKFSWLSLLLLFGMLVLVNHFMANKLFGIIIAYLLYNLLYLLLTRFSCRYCLAENLK
jgi:O-antigen/teichoic acid export membrane protein